MTVPSAWLLLLTGGAGAGVAQLLDKLVTHVVAARAEKRKELGERRKLVLDATVAMVTAKQNTGKDYYAGDVSALFTRLMYLVEHDGDAWDKAKYHAEAHGQNAAELRGQVQGKKLEPPK
jgi:hypothetical protein